MLLTKSAADLGCCGGESCSPCARGCQPWECCRSEAAAATTTTTSVWRPHHQQQQHRHQREGMEATTAYRQEDDHLAMGSHRSHDPAKAAAVRPVGLMLAESRNSPFSAVPPPAGDVGVRVRAPPADPQGAARKIFDLSRPPIGSRNTQGRRPRMEDTDTVVHNLLEDMPVLLVDGGRIVPKPVERGLSGLFDEEDDDSPASPRTVLARFASDDSEEGLRSSIPQVYGQRRGARIVRSNFHFAGVFDGHGGQAVSKRVAEGLHVHVRDALRQAQRPQFSPSGFSDSNAAAAAVAAADEHEEDTVMEDASGVSGSWRTVSSNGDTMAGPGHRMLKRKLPSCSSPQHQQHHHHHAAALRDSSNSITACSCSTSSLPASQLQQLDAVAAAMMMSGGESSSFGCVRGGGGFAAKPPLHKTARKGANPVGPANPQALSMVTIERIAEGLSAAFRQMDEELAAEEECKHVGSTAVVSLVSRENIFVANCGDSRAVLSRAGCPYRLSRDHKPELDDEQERIERYGGKVLDFNGKRVMGLLAMTRAFGDHFLRDVGVIAEPEITAINRTDADEFLILGSDGLWDVLGDREACDLARKCFRRAEERGAGPDTASRVAASVLMRAALDRGSGDNITVVVVDLRPETQMVP